MKKIFIEVDTIDNWSRMYGMNSDTFWEYFLGTHLTSNTRQDFAKRLNKRVVNYFCPNQDTSCIDVIVMTHRDGIGTKINLEKLLQENSTYYSHLRKLRNRGIDIAPIA